MAKEPVILSDEIIPPPALVRAGLEILPAIIAVQGERAGRRFIEFFTATVRNRNTRMAYARAVKRFFDYWKPVYYVLEQGFTVLLVNPTEIMRLPGRKTDVSDSVWPAQLENGLLRPSYIPPRTIRELRDLVRYRTQLRSQPVHTPD